MKYKYSKLYWFVKNLEWMKVYFSPFKFFLPKLYIGKIAIGCPYFLPRVWKKPTPKKAIEEALKEIKRVREHNEKEGSYKQTIESFDTLYEQKLNSSFSQPKKIGFDFVGLGYKTKWSNTDFRHEWNPIWSFVFFGYQIALIFRPENDCHYWESWLYYNLATDKSKSAKERIEQCRKEAPQTWTRHNAEEKETIDYYELILKYK